MSVTVKGRPLLLELIEGVQAQITLSVIWSMTFIEQITFYIKVVGHHQSEMEIFTNIWLILHCL